MEQRAKTGMTARRPAEPGQRVGGGRVLFGRDVEIPVPDVPPEEAAAGDAESQALAAHPAVQAMFEEGRRKRAAGQGIPAEEMYRRYAYRPPAERQAGRDSAYSGCIRARVPRSLHRELVERAEAEGVRLNQLILSYVSRGLGPAA